MESVTVHYCSETVELNTKEFKNFKGETESEFLEFISELIRNNDFSGLRDSTVEKLEKLDGERKECGNSSDNGTNVVLSLLEETDRGFLQKLSIQL